MFATGRISASQPLDNTKLYDSIATTESQQYETRVSSNTAMTFASTRSVTSSSEPHLSLRTKLKPRRRAAQIDRKFPCKLCPRSYGSLSALTLHISTKHVVEAEVLVGNPGENLTSREARLLALRFSGNSRNVRQAKRRRSFDHVSETAPASSRANVSSTSLTDDILFPDISKDKTSAGTAPATPVLALSSCIPSDPRASAQQSARDDPVVDSMQLAAAASSRSSCYTNSSICYQSSSRCHTISTQEAVIAARNVTYMPAATQNSSQINDTVMPLPIHPNMQIYPVLRPTNTYCDIMNPYYMMPRTNESTTTMGYRNNMVPMMNPALNPSTMTQMPIYQHTSWLPTHPPTTMFSYR